MPRKSNKLRSELVNPAGAGLRCRFVSELVLRLLVPRTIYRPLIVDPVRDMIYNFNRL